MLLDGDADGDEGVVVPESTPVWMSRKEGTLFRPGVGGTSVYWLLSSVISSSEASVREGYISLGYTHVAGL